MTANPPKDDPKATDWPYTPKRFREDLARLRLTPRSFADVSTIGRRAAYRFANGEAVASDTPRRIRRAVLLVCDDLEAEVSRVKQTGDANVTGACAIEDSR